MDGELLALELNLQGARTDEGWSGSLQHLVINVKDAARLALREPANIVIDKDSAELSQMCLVDNRIELCAAGARQADGAIRASDPLANVPLALGNALATSEMPIALEGTLQGHGEVRRTAQGELFGDVLIESESGSISRHLAAAPGDETQEAPQKLLSYHGLRLAATLSGPDARASFDSGFDPNGTLHAEASGARSRAGFDSDHRPSARTDPGSRTARSVRAAAGEVCMAASTPTSEWAAPLKRPSCPVS